MGLRQSDHDDRWLSDDFAELGQVVLALTLAFGPSFTQGNLSMAKKGGKGKGGGGKKC